MQRRRALPLVLVAIATLLAFLAIFALWANRQLLDTDNWTDTSSALLQDEDIREQISIFLVDELYSNVDVQGELEGALPPRGAALAGPLASGLQSPLQEGVKELLDRPRVQALWEEANRRAHRRFLQIVEGGGDNVSTEGGDVTLDLQGMLGASGAGGALADRLPPDAAQLTVLKSDELELAQDLVDFMKALAWILLILAIGLYALAVYLARGWRREAFRAVGFGLAFAGALALVLRSVAGDGLTDSLAETEGVKPAIQSTWSIGTSLFQEAASAALAYGIVIVAFAWLAGPTRLAVANRRAMAPYLRDPRYAWGSFTIVVLVILAWGPTPATRKLLGALLIIGLLALGLEMLRRQVAREFPDASIEESVERWRQRFARLGTRGGRGEAVEGNRVEQLERLGKLRDSGVIDASEFDREKARILERAPSGAA
jgi:Short C-terminal domain